MRPCRASVTAAAYPRALAPITRTSYTSCLVSLLLLEEVQEAEVAVVIVDPTTEGAKQKRCESAARRKGMTAVLIPESERVVGLCSLYARNDGRQDFFGAVFCTLLLVRRDRRKSHSIKYKHNHIFE